MANYLGNCENCGEQKPCACVQSCNVPGGAIFEGEFTPVNVTVGGFVYMVQGDSQITVDRAAAIAIARAILSASPVPVDASGTRDAKTIAAEVLQSACETDPADSEHPDTIMISCEDLETIVRLTVEYADERASLSHTAPVADAQAKEGE